MPNYQAQYRIAPVEFRPVEFKPGVFESQIPNTDLLQRALAIREERRTKASELQAGAVKLLGETRAKFHDDPETNAWMNKKSDEITNVMNEYAAAGDYEGLQHFARNAAFEFLNDPETEARRRSNEKYNEWLTTTKKLTEGDNPEVFEMLKDQNPYTFNAIPNADGTFSGDWEPVRSYVSKQDITEIAARFKAIVVPKVTDKETQRSSSGGDGSSSSSMNRTRTEVITPEQFKKEWDAYRQIEPQVDSWIAQEYDLNAYIYNKYKDSTDPVKKERAEKALANIADDKGTRKSLQQYQEEFTKTVWDNLSMDNLTTVSHSHSGAPSSGTSTGPTGPTANPPAMQFWDDFGRQMYGGNFNIAGTNQWNLNASPAVTSTSKAMRGIGNIFDYNYKVPTNPTIGLGMQFSLPNKQRN